MAVVQMTAEQFDILINAVRQTALTDAPVSKQKASFSNCSNRFGGDRDHNIVEEFITSVLTYKDVEGISDEDALKGISLLFYGLASTWWQGVRKEAKTWNDAVELIRSHFSPTKPSYQVYMEIFQDKQNERTAIDTFVCQKRALLAQLPDDRHDEQTQLDFIYGLLNIKYRKKIARDDIKSFKELLDKGRIVEQTTEESRQTDNPPAFQRKGNTKRCSYCNYRGHTFDECKKRKPTDDQE